MASAADPTSLDQPHQKKAGSVRGLQSAVEIPAVAVGIFLQSQIVFLDFSISELDFIGHIRPRICR